MRRGAVFLAWPLLLSACSPRQAPPNGIALDAVVPGHAAHRAGLREDDVLAVGSLPELRSLARRSDAGQEVRVKRLRPRPAELRLPKAAWAIDARPALSAEDEAAHRVAREAFRQGRPEAAGSWAALAARREAAGDVAGAVFFHLQQGRALLQERRIDEAQKAAQAACEAARADERLQAWAHERWGAFLGHANEHALAEHAYVDALSRTPHDDALARAALLQYRAVGWFRRGHIEEAARLAQEALEVRERAAPGSGALGETLLTLARVARHRGRYEEATAHVERALDAARAADPGGPDEAAALVVRGVIANHRGDLAAEERWGEQAIRILERWGVQDLVRGRACMRVAAVAYGRGDLALAEQRYRAALSTFEAEAPESLHVSWALLGLGQVLRSRGDLDGAEDAFRRSVSIRATIGRNSEDHAIALEHLGTVLRARGDLDAAERAYREALGMLRERTGDHTFDGARMLANLGEVLADQHRFDEARALVAQSVKMHERRAAGSLEHAEALTVLGHLERNAGRRPEAERAHRRALAIRSRLAPGSVREAESLYAVAVLERRSGRLQAAETLRRAVAALETQRTRLGGGPEERARFGATFAHVHRELLDQLLELRRDGEAFDLWERYRVGGLGALLGQRDLHTDATLPEPLRRQREELRREYDRIQASLARLDAAEGHRAEVDAHVARLRALRAERASLASSLHQAQPELAALEDPRPPRLEQIARWLGDGTLLVSFAVLPERTVLFAMAGGDAPELETHTLALPEAQLRRDVEVVGDLLRSPHAPAEARRALTRRLHALYRALLAPVQRRLARSRRLVVLPDGPLHLVPFAALVTKDGARPRHLIEERSVMRAASLMLAAHAPRRSPTASLLVLGDPQLDVRGAGLVGARAEVEAIGRLFGERARVLTGAEASEARAKALSAGARYLHFATHGVADDRFPLDSYLALSPSHVPGSSDDGRLQAWEIYEQLELDADLVTLSACESGLGAELGGAGLVGLTYAFQFAGARSVVASLWPVSDRSTAALMRAFYASLAAGAAPEEALRHAQLSLLPDPLPAETAWAGLVRRLFSRPVPEDLPLDTTHPYHWASFQLFGATQAVDSAATVVTAARSR